MPFYQVLVAVESEAGKLRPILTDLSEEQLSAQFVQPYRKGIDLICGNEIVSLASLRKVHIVRTERTDAQERSALNDKSLKEMEAINREADALIFIGLGRGYEPEDILEVGADVTAQFISGPPGHAQGRQWVLRLLSNEWVVAVGAGLIVAGIVWWLGWS